MSIAISILTPFLLFDNWKNVRGIDQTNLNINQILIQPKRIIKKKIRSIRIFIIYRLLLFQF